MIRSLNIAINKVKINTNAFTRFTSKLENKRAQKLPDKIKEVDTIGKTLSAIFILIDWGENMFE